MRHRHAAAALLFLLCGAALAGPSPTVSGIGAAPVPAAGNGLAADFTLPDLEGRPVELRAFLGKSPVLLVFWATWCPECKAAVPEINSLVTGPLRGRLQVFGINYKESPEKVSHAVRARGIRYTILLDERGEVAKAYGISGIPAYTIVDRQGRIVYRNHVLPADLSRLVGT